MDTRWFLTVTAEYVPDEDGCWRGRWIGRAWNQRGKLRGLSFASRRRRCLWAFWVGGTR